MLDVLGISHDDGIAEDWLSVVGEGNSGSLAARAHRSALTSPRPADVDFMDFFDRFEGVLDTVMERFESEFSQIFDRLDDLLAKEVPTAADATSLRQTFPAIRATSIRFFPRAGVAWLEPLRRAGYFTDPPTAEYDHASGMAALPFWPESEYLARVGKLDPVRAVSIAVAIPPTDNSRVNYDLVELALAVPAVDSERLVPNIIAALGTRFGVLIPHRVGELLVHLCAAGRVDQVIDLTNALLRGFPDRQQASRTDAYEAAEILREHLPAVVAAMGMPAFQLLTSLLDEELEDGAGQWSRAGGDDGSAMWRPMLGEPEPRVGSDLRQALVTVIRDAALSLAERGPDAATDVIAELESHSWLIFRRLSLHVLTAQAASLGDMVTERLTNHQLMSERWLAREYLLLARAGAASLNAAATRRIWTLIDRGPQIPAAEQDPQQPAPAADQFARSRLARWRRDRFAAFESVLPPEENAKYQSLVAEFEPAPDPAAPVPEIEFEEVPGVPTPSAAELAVLPTAALVELLRSWSPPAEDRWEQSAGALRGALHLAVREDARRVSLDAALFIGLPAAFVGAVFDGLWQAHGGGVELDWGRVMELAAWVDQQAVAELTAPSSQPHERQWREPRIDMLQLFIAGLSGELAQFTEEELERVLGIIERCCDDPDPDPGTEAVQAYDGDGGYLTFNVYAVRPYALEAAIALGLRLHAANQHGGVARVLAVLDQHLDRWQDSSLAVRAVYGKKFASLMRLNSGWAQQCIPAIFPVGADPQLLVDASLDAYLSSQRMSTEIWTVQAGTYSAAVDRMPEEGGRRSGEERAENLGWHLLYGLWNNLISIDSGDGLLRRYYAHVSPEVAAQLMSLIATRVHRQPAVDEALKARLTALWEFRLTAARSDRKWGIELREFGLWFASKHFTARWRLEQLITTLELAGEVDSEDKVLTELEALCPDHLYRCLDVLDMWADHGQWGRRTTRHLGTIRGVLGIGMAGDATAVVKSKRIISKLLREHNIDLRDLLKSDTTT
ncbi:hypothetical protein AB0M43_36670 [Longispora sp. NPDC051575]|uniref:hypothetical protein n=1 Tax=Longispora sp. NPDC051575 TaxID=3154943 RepID=UPI00341FBF4C